MTWADALVCKQAEVTEVLITMGIADMQREYWVPECIREYRGALGVVLPLEAMEG